MASFKGIIGKNCRNYRKLNTKLIEERKKGYEN